MQLFEYRSVEYQSKRDQWDTYWGPKKVFFFIRGVDDATPGVVEAPVELSQFVAQRSPWGRFGSILYTFNRLHRIRLRFNQSESNSLSSPHNLRSNSPGFVFRAFGSSRLPHRQRARFRRLIPSNQPLRRPRVFPHPQTVFYLGSTAPVNVKYANYSRAPRKRTSGLVGSHTTPPIVEKKVYDIYTTRRVLWAARARV